MQFVGQLKKKIRSICDASCLVRRRQGGVSGEKEESLSVLLSFDQTKSNCIGHIHMFSRCFVGVGKCNNIDVESLPNKMMLVYISYPV
jgi:hypothetical protein